MSQIKKDNTKLAIMLILPILSVFVKNLKETCKAHRQMKIIKMVILFPLFGLFKSVVTKIGIAIST